MDTCVIDNFLSNAELNNLKNDLNHNESFPLYYTPKVSGKEKKGNDDYWNYYFAHVFYDHDAVKSQYLEKFYNVFIPKIKKLYPYKSLLRVKLNFYPHTSILREHEKHVDTTWSHYGAIFSLNTCDGYTKLKDGTKVNSVENRLLLFDAGNPHCSSTCTNKKARFNINFNYF